jgi:hypothetical protein
MEKSDLYWKQRAKTDWLKNSDRNTWFYHACATSWMKKNYISRIINEGGSFVRQRRISLQLLSLGSSRLHLRET